MSDITPIEVGESVHITQGRYATVEEVRELSNGTYLFKTKGDQGEQDYQTRIRSENHRAKSIEYGRFAVDLVMKHHHDPHSTDKVFESIVSMWHGKNIEELLDTHNGDYDTLPGYELEFILSALDWILENEDNTFSGRSDSKQSTIDSKFSEKNVSKPEGRAGSQLAMGLFAGIVSGNHPVDELNDADLYIAKRSR